MQCTNCSRGPNSLAHGPSIPAKAREAEGIDMLDDIVTEAAKRRGSEAGEAARQVRQRGSEAVKLKKNGGDVTKKMCVCVCVCVCVVERRKREGESRETSLYREGAGDRKGSR
jgi:hypothetical protein